MNTRTESIAISNTEYQLYGCPHCGCTLGRSTMRAYGTMPIKCGNDKCNKSFVVLDDGLKESAISFGEKKMKPVLQSHPRIGTPKWDYVAPDIRPKRPYSDYFYSRGIGYDLAGFVNSKVAGERIINMFKVALEKNEIKTWLDYRKHEPTHIQVKVQRGECDLEKLDRLIEENESVITMEVIKECVIK